MTYLRKNVYIKDSEMSPLVLQFLDIQDSFSNTIVYLIEKEIATNGIRNLGNTIPQVRTRSYWENYVKGNITENHLQPPPTPLTLLKDDKPTKNTNEETEDIISASVSESEMNAEPQTTHSEDDGNVTANPLDKYTDEPEEETVDVPSCYS